MKVVKFKRGQIWWCTDTTKYDGHVQGGTRPVIIISNDIANEKENTLIGIPCTTAEKEYLPCNYSFIMNGIKNTALGTNIRSINPDRLTSYIGTCDEELMNEIDKCIKVSLGLSVFPETIDSIAVHHVGVAGIENAIPQEIKVEPISIAESNNTNYVVKDIQSTQLLETNLDNADSIMTPEEPKKVGRAPKHTEADIIRFLNDYENHDNEYMLKKYKLKNAHALHQQAYLFRKKMKAVV